MFLNQVTIRIVAAIVFTIGAFNLFLESKLLMVFLLFGFASRSIWASKVDPIARFVDFKLVPLLKLKFKPTPATPKRFAQAIGAFCTLGALWLSFIDNYFASKIILTMVVVFAFLEAAFGFCAGCFLFNLLVKVGLIPQEECKECSDITF